MLCVVAFALLLGRLQARLGWLHPNTLVSRIIFGVVFGALAVLAIKIPITISDGVHIGLTPAMTICATLFGGIESGGIVIVVVLATRLLQGDALAAPTVPVVLLTWACASVASLHRRRREELPKLRDLAWLGLLSALATICTALTWPEPFVRPAIVAAFAPYWIAVTIVTTVMIGGILIYVERDRALQRALEESRAMLIQAHELGRIGYSHSDPKTGRVRLSDSLFALRRLPRRDSFSVEEAVAVICEPDRQRYLAARQAAIDHKQEFDGDFRVQRGDGSIGWERICGRAIYDQSGNVVDFITVCQDITAAKEAERALRISEERYELMADGSREGMFDRDMVSGIGWFSERAHQIVGQPNGAMNGDRAIFLSYIHPDDLSAYEDQTVTLLARGDVRLPRLFRMRHADGSWVWIESHARVVYDNGTAIRIVGSFGDVTGRVTAEAELKASEAKFAAAFRNSVDPLVITRVEDGIYLETNNAAAGLAGWRYDEMIGRTAEQLGVWASPEERHLIRLLVASEGVVRDHPIRIKTKSGDIRDCLITASTIEVGGKPCVISTVRDVTKNLRAERLLAEINAERDAHLRRLRDITDNLPVLIALFDRDDRILFVNRIAARWFDRPIEDIQGCTRRDLLPDHQLKLDDDVIPRVLAGEMLQVERAIAYPDGVTRDVEMTYFPETEAAGRVRGYYALITEITERKAKDAQLRQAQRMEAVGQLTGGVAHDFNNLLSTISGSLELVEGSFDAGDDRRLLLRTALRATQRGTTLTRSLLAFARQQPLEPRSISPNALVDEMIELVRRTTPENIAMEFVPDSEAWTCEVDPGQLQNALLNLVANARDAMPDGGRLTIGCSTADLSDIDAAQQADVTPGSYVVITLADTGCGMPPETLAKAFEPFFTTKEIGQGTGLGLSMVYGFAKQSNGHIRIYSEVGHGTTVRLYLPRSTKRDEMGVADAPAVRGATGKGEIVLVVEDEADLRFIAERMLRASGYQVVSACDATEGMQRLADAPGIALVLTDLMLSGDRNGFQFADDACAQRPGMKVLFMSGHADGIIRHQARATPDAPILQKPFTKEELAAKVRQLLDGAAL